MDSSYATSHHHVLSQHPTNTSLQVWIRPGGGLAEDYLAFLQSFTNDNTEATILLILGVFALFHSGLAGLRPQGACVGH
jgi:hypothetical protein